MILPEATTIGAEAPTIRDRLRPSGPSTAQLLRGRVASFWMNALIWSLERQPWIARLARRPGLAAAWRWSPLRNNLLLNAARLLGPHSTIAARERLGRAVLASFYDFLTDMSELPNRSVQELDATIADVSGLEHYQAARRLGRGAILVTAHLGAFEVGMHALRRHEPRVHVVFRRDPWGMFDRMRTAVRRRLGIIEAPANDGIESWLRLRDALHRNDVIVLQGDRVISTQRGFRVRFLNGHVNMPTGPAKLALATGAPIVPIFAPRDADGRVRIALHESRVLDQNGDPCAVESTVLWLAKLIEEQVRKHPEQWLTVHRAWCEDGEDVHQQDGVFGG